MIVDYSALSLSSAGVFPDQGGADIVSIVTPHPGHWPHVTIRASHHQRQRIVTICEEAIKIFLTWQTRLNVSVSCYMLTASVRFSLSHWDILYFLSDSGSGRSLYFKFLSLIVQYNFTLTWLPIVQSNGSTNLIVLIVPPNNPQLLIDSLNTTYLFCI